MRKELKKDCEIEKGVYGLEITTTQACNFQCSYCFERDHVPEERLLDAKIIIKRVRELLNAEWFKAQFSGIKLILWGGEPTMNMPLCKTLMEVFKQDERIAFFMYTNGSTIDNLMPTLRRLKGQPFVKKGISKCTIQVSYDGHPLHDWNRRTKQDNETSHIVNHAIEELHKYGIDYGLKATIDWDDYIYLPNTWDDYARLHDKFGSKIKYSLTINYYDVKFSGESRIKSIENVLVKIAQREIKFFKTYGYFLSNIFRSNRAYCATGKSMAVIDTNGDVYNCHGAIYSKCSNDFKYTNIFHKNFINNIQKANKLYFDNHIEPNECAECIAGSCLRCNVKKYEESKKETHLDKWFDYPAQKDLCKYYQLVGKIGFAVESILKEK